MRPLFFAVLVSASAACFAQKEMVGEDLFPQFRSLGGLPGNMVPIGPGGAPNYFGALSLSTPVAYTLSGWHGVAGFGSMSFDMSLKFPKGKDKEANGTAQFMLGTSLGKFGSLSGGLMILSGLGDNAFNLQWSPPKKDEKVQFAIGVQDIRGGGGSAGEGQPTDSDSSRSFYGVATMALNEKTHFSIGTGTRRFKGIFANVSTNITPTLKATLEYDAFNFNYGLAYRIASFGKLKGETYDTAAQSADIHAFLGVVRGKFLFWGVGVSF